MGDEHMPYEYLNQFGNKVKLLRIKQKWEPKEFARRLGWSVETLYLVEKGDEQITVVQAMQVAQTLKVPLYKLLQ